MDTKDRDVFMMAVQVAAQIGADSYCSEIDFKEHDDEIFERMRRHEVPEEWFVRVRSLAYTFHNFAALVTEYAPTHIENKAARASKKKLSSKA